MRRSPSVSRFRSRQRARDLLSHVARAVVTSAGCVLALANAPYALDNGLARTPPMGWNSFNCFGGGWTPYSITSVGDALAASGLRDLGYVYCVNDGNNDGTAPYFPGSSGFVNFAKPIADYVHAKNLKYGCYTSSLSNAQTVAANLVSVGADFLKIDAWTTDISSSGWATMRDAFLAAGRPILYSIHSGSNSGTTSICNMWRTGNDIAATWDRCLENIHSNSTGGGSPGGWPDPDMLEVGNFNPPNDTVEKAIFSLWCVVSAPLILGNDPRNLYPMTTYILQNTEAIAVDQDTSFVADASSSGSGKMVRQLGTQEVWRKSLAGGAMAVVLFNTGTAAAAMTIRWADLGMSAGVAQVRDLWEHQNLGSFTDQYSTTVPPHGCVFIKIVPGSAPIPEPPATWYPKPPTTTPDAGVPLDRTGWTISTSMTFTYCAAAIGVLLDGDPATRWYSLPTFPAPSSPQWVLIDMGSAKTFNRIVLDDEKQGPALPRAYEQYVQDNTYEIMVSNDNVAWRGPVATGGWPYRGAFRFSTAINFEDQTARYVKIVCKAAADDADQSKTGFTIGYDEIYLVNVAGGSITRTSPLSVIPQGAATGVPATRFLGRGNNRSVLGVEGRYIFDLSGRLISAPTPELPGTGMTPAVPWQRATSVIVVK